MLLLILLFLFPKGVLFIQTEAMDVFNLSPQEYQTSMISSSGALFLDLNDESLPLDKRISIAKDLIFNSSQPKLQEIAINFVLSTIDSHRKILLLEEVDPATNEYFPLDGYRDLMIILGRLKMASSVDFLLNLLEKTKDWSKFNEVSIAEYIFWAFNEVALNNLHQIPESKVREVLKSIYSKAKDEKITLFSNSAISKIMKQYPDIFYIPFWEVDMPQINEISVSDRLVIQNALSNFSFADLVRHIEVLESFTSRKIGTNGHKLAFSYICNFLKQAGYSPDIQEFSYFGKQFKNIIVRIQGCVEPEKKIVVFAHYDSISTEESELAPGANDNGSGVALILELARFLKNLNLHYTLEFVFFDAEEIGKYGSQFYVRNSLLKKEEIVSAINIDSIGWDNDGRLEIIGDSHSENLVEKILNIASSLGDSSFLSKHIIGSGLSDELSFWNHEGTTYYGGRGRYRAILVTGGISSNDLDPGENTSGDTITHLNFDFLTRASEYIAKIIISLADPVDSKKILLDRFVNLCSQNKIDIDGLWFLSQSADSIELEKLILAFELIPPQHLQYVKMIKFTPPKVGAGYYEADQGIITISEQMPKALIHETGHLVLYGLKDNPNRFLQDADSIPAFIKERGFHKDYNFLAVFYYTPPAIPEEWLDPSGVESETFAVMYHMYLIEADTLKEWIINEFRNGNTIPLLNYLYLKYIVFKGEEYGKTKIWIKKYDDFYNVYYEDKDGSLRWSEICK